MSANHSIDFRAKHDSWHLSRRARILVTEELARLLATAGARSEIIELAHETWRNETDAVGRLSLLADAAWVAAADEMAAPSRGARLRADLLLRAASLAGVMRLYVELLACESSGADQVLKLAEQLAWGDLAEPVSPGAAIATRSRPIISSWRASFRELAAWFARTLEPSRFGR